MLRLIKQFVNRDARMDNVATNSSHWVDLQPDLVVKVSADLSLLDVRRSQVRGDNTDSLVQLNISQHKKGLASWSSKRGGAFDVLSFGTAFRPAELSLEGWQFVLSAFLQGVQGAQLKLSVASLGFILMPLDERLRQLCTALYVGHGLDLTVEQFANVSLLSSLRSLEMDLAMDDYMGYLPSCWTRLRHLHSLTLHKCKAVPSVLSTLASLRSHAVTFISYHTQQCLETLSQLTSLHISMDPLETCPSIFAVLLPKGMDVQLRHLTLKLNTQPENLQRAGQLTRLDIAIGAAMAARRQWHAPLSKLRVINVFETDSNWVCLGTSCYWATAWQHSTNLERLTLGGWLVKEIPDWVTKFQLLRCLELPSAWLLSLNVTDLMQLPVLEQLNIGNCTSKLVENSKLTIMIVECAYLPALKQFTYGFKLDLTVKSSLTHKVACSVKF